MISETVTIVNQLGLHARAAAKFVHLAGRYQAHVRVAGDVRETDGKSIMGILLLAAACGTQITISADGADERDAVAALTALVKSGFREDRAAAPGAAGEASVNSPGAEGPHDPGPSGEGPGSLEG